VPDSHHDHLIDVQTGKVIEFRNEEIEKLQRRVAEELGFELVDHRLELWRAEAGQARRSLRTRCHESLRGCNSHRISVSTLLLIPMASVPRCASSLKRRKTFPSAIIAFCAACSESAITVIGKPIQDRGVLMVANHTSYFDILCFPASRGFFRREKRSCNWPLFGTLGKLQQPCSSNAPSERNRRSARSDSRTRRRRRCAGAVSRRHVNDGNRVLPFKSALMGAVETEMGTDAQGRPLHVPVQPVSVAYVGMHGLPMGRENRPLFAWYGDMDLVPICGRR
jgi:1-acyl-sn-glycerol-3-phosphate acyltransferase